MSASVQRVRSLPSVHVGEPASVVAAAAPPAAAWAHALPSWRRAAATAPGSVAQKSPALDKLALGAFVECLPDHVRVERNDGPDGTVLVLKSVAKDPQSGVANGGIDRPAAYLEWSPAGAPDAEHLSFLGFQCAEFAFPVRAADTDLTFPFFNRPGYVRPHSVLPLVIFNSKTSTCTLLAPLDHFHDQVMSVTPACTIEEKDSAADEKKVKNGGVLRWGWSGDIDLIPVGFRTSLALLSGSSPNELFARWGAMVQAQSDVKPRSAYADISTQAVSMWTDNGAAYWYRCEPNMDLPTTLERTIQSLEEQNIPIAAVELDSWFYDHEVARAITDIGYCDLVPPTGMLRWEPRADALGTGGISGLRARLGKRPLILHSRHISARSSYLLEQDWSSQDLGSVISSSTGEASNEGSANSSSSMSFEEPDAAWWIDGERAHPVGSDLFYRWMRQAADWGATTYEQDWLVEIWMGMRQLRAVPGRIAAWQNALNDAATAHDVSLIWCMATPADMALAASLSRIVAVRTCDDYRYAPDPAVLWRWHLTTSCLARSLNLWPFKDVFISNNKTNGAAVDIDGDPNAELEALLSALSGGPVGIGDRMGRTNRDIVMRTCRADGILIKPDMPLAACDRSLWVERNASPLIWADTFSDQWRYVVVIHAGLKKDATESEEAVSGSMDIAADGEERLVYDWRTKTARLASSVSVSLRTHEWEFFVVCPVDKTMMSAVIGDVGVYATMGTRRAQVNRLPCGSLASVDVTGSPGEVVQFASWSASGGVYVQQVTVLPKAWTRMRLGIVGWRPAEKSACAQF